MLLTEARLSAPPAPRLLKYHDLPALEREKKQFHEFVAVDLAHTAMLVEEGIISAAVGRAILEQLLAIRRFKPADFPTDVRKGSFLLQVEAYLFGAVGEDVGGQMHTGRSRIDQGATVRRLYKRNRTLERDGPAQRPAGRHRRTGAAPCPNHHARLHPHAARAALGLRSLPAELQFAFARQLPAPDRSLDPRESQPARRGGPGRHVLAVEPRTHHGIARLRWPGGEFQARREAYYAAEAIAALAFVMADLNDLATDLHVWSSTEFGLVESDDSYCSTSSIFPQKKNPAGLETIKKAAGSAVTWLATALATFRAEGTGDQAVRDLPLIDEALTTTEGMLDLFTGVIETLIVHEDRMAASLNGSWCTSSNLADVIVRERGLSFRQAHHIVARVVRNALGEGHWSERADQRDAGRGGSRNGGP